MTLKELQVGKTATILSVGGNGALRQHFLDMGLIQGTEVTIVKYAPMGDPVEIRIHGYELTIRLEDAGQIEITPAHEPHYKKKEGRQPLGDAQHPGYGEAGIFHEKKTEHPLPENTTLTFALVGNQNCGKTTLFNQLTGSNQHVGNFPGVTVDRKDGVIKEHPNTRITDLPGIYSMSPYSSEEIVTREFLLQDKPKGIINIVDATNIERNMYLTMQLMELEIPMVVALNMMDEMRVNGGSVRVNELEAFLGVPVVPISAAKGEGIAELVEHALHVAKYQEAPEEVDFCSAEGQESAVHRCIHAIMHLIEDHAKEAGIPVRFAASKLAENDELVLEKLKLSQNEKELLEHINLQMEEECKVDRSSAVAGMRFNYIQRACEDTVLKPHESRERVRSRKIDQILTGKYTGIPAFIAIMGLVFWLTFNVIGAFLQDLLQQGIDQVIVACSQALDAAGVNGVLKSLIVDGIFQGVGSVLSFLPIIVTLFFFLSMLEDSGYMARVAFIMDKLLRKIGLSGRSIVPMLIGFGCTVPGVMASRTLSSERDRKMTIMLTPFMSCSAKLPIYAFFTAAFFPGKGAIVMIGLYFFGILMGILTALAMKGTMFKGEPVPFVMELPAYHWPTVSNVLRSMWERGWSFIKKAGTIILMSTIVLWFLMNFGWVDGSFGMLEAEQLNDSILASIGSVIAPLFAPLGWGDWKMAVAAVSGLIAKENVVGTFGILFGFGEVAEDGAEIWGQLAGSLSTVAAYSFLVFNLLCAPCFAAMGAIKREMNNTKWFFTAIGYQTLLAYVVSLCIYQIGNLFIGGGFGIGTVVAVLLIIGFVYLLVRPYKESATLSVSTNKMFSK